MVIKFARVSLIPSIGPQNSVVRRRSKVMSARGSQASLARMPSQELADTLDTAVGLIDPTPVQRNALSGPTLEWTSQSLRALAQVRKPLPMPLGYADFELFLRTAMASPSIATRRQLLQVYNAHVAPRLITEEAALSYLVMRLAYVHLPKNASWSCAITRNIEGAPRFDYANTYTLAAHLCDRVQGCVAFCFKPRRSKGRTLIVFRGTCVQNGRDVLLKDHPTGVRADLDEAGVGYTAFQANRKHIMEWVQSALAARQGVTIAGHSLGAVFAARTISELTPAQQMQSRLFMYHAPGLEEAIAAKIVGGAERVRKVRNLMDPINLVGPAHPVGAPICYRTVGTALKIATDLTAHHTDPVLAQQELDGSPLAYMIQEEAFVPQFDGLRRLLGRLAQNYVEP